MNITEAEKKYLSKIDDWKTFEKIIKQMLLMIYTLKTQKYVLPIFPKLIVIVKKKICLNDTQRRKKKLALFSSKKTIPTVESNNITT